MERLSREQRLRLRSSVVATVRTFFEARDYLEVETPILVPSPGLDLHLDAFAVEGGHFLSTSPEYQMKRLLSEGLPRIFQIGKCFRRGERGAQHNPEFTMLEWYAAGMAAAGLMDETEALVGEVLGTDSFARLTVCEAFQRFAGIGRSELLQMAANDEERYFRLLIDAVEPELATMPAVFLYDYPGSQASLARRKPGDPDLCERFELYVGGIELCNGFGELTDPDEQRERFLQDQARRRAEGKPVYPIDERFMAALEQGMPDAAGNALGLDRLVAIRAGAQSIADVMTFSSETV